MQVGQFDCGGVAIAWREAGEGRPVVLIHGFAANARGWLRGGWFETLTRSGHRVIAPDLRGHGASQKLYAPSAYRIADFARDVAALIDHLGLGRADILGYSMGARIAATVAVERPARVRSLVLGGMGLSLFAGNTGSEETAAAIERGHDEPSDDARIRSFRQLIERTGSDRRAMAACMRCPREAVAEHRLVALDRPILLFAGTGDQIAPDVADLASHLPQARMFPVPGSDHMRAVNDPRVQARVVAFLDEHG